MALPVWRLFVRTSWRRVILLFVLMMLVFSMTILNINYVSYITPDKESYILQGEIIKLSEKYVRALAQESQGVVDGPYAARFTAYDLKKTIAVLLESILTRLDRLEEKVNVLSLNRSSRGSLNQLDELQQNTETSINAKDILMGKVERCNLTLEDQKAFPFCKEKLEWMRRMWKSHSCYSSYGVDGSECSFIMYLSEVEGWCPSRAWKGSSMKLRKQADTISYADAVTELDPLMNLLVDPNERQGYAFMRMRIRRLWPKWSRAIKNLVKNQKMNTRTKKRKRMWKDFSGPHSDVLLCIWCTQPLYGHTKVLVHLGLLTKQTGWKFAENQFKGGPLGELVQWSDLISILYLLGHNLTITSEFEHLSGILNRLPSVLSPCQARKDLPVDIIYTDLAGLRQFKKHVKSGYGKFSCLLRIVDSFGTEPAYNHRNYARRKKLLTTWGGQDLMPQQFFTMFPHTPDNSFMGFVVEQHLKDDVNPNAVRKNQAVVYGKNEYMWNGKAKYLDVVKEFTEVHSTVYMEEKKHNNVIPLYVINHGLLKGEELHGLLRESKLFIGLGFPYEGPAPLEAIANGCIFINPKFNPPHSNKNTQFFKGKPTSRKVTSQHPYAERYIGKPHVYTVNINNLQEVRKVLKEVILNNNFTPYMPYEYTEEGMLQRMNAYIENQNFCAFQNTATKWPPPESVQMFLGELGKSCNDVCWERNLICEPSYFEDTNTAAIVEKYSSGCKSRKTLSDIIYPAYNPAEAQCYYQAEKLLFSCAGGQSLFQRICPCRNFIPGQIALCQNCIR